MDDYCPDDGPAFTKLDCGHWACWLENDECRHCAFLRAENDAYERWEALRDAPWNQ